MFAPQAPLLPHGSRISALEALPLTGGGVVEYIVAPVNLTVHRPLEVSIAEGAALPIAAGTGLQTQFDGIGKPANVLVTAASGGVGHFTVQLAKLGNHHVTGTCRARNLYFLKSLGADEVLDVKPKCQ